MHEEVLSAATLEKAFKETFNPVGLHLQECKYSSASVEGASVSPGARVIQALFLFLYQSSVCVPPPPP